MKKLILWVITLMVAVFCITGCSSEKKEKAVIGATLATFEKEYGKSNPEYDWAVFEKSNFSVKLFNGHIVRISADKGCKLTYKDFIPEDAKEVRKTQKMGDETIYLFSKSFDDKIIRNNQDYNIYVLKIRGKDTSPFSVYSNFKAFKTENNKETEKSNNISNSNKADSNTSSIFASTQNVTTEQLINSVKIDRTNSPLLNKKVKFTASVRGKYIDDNGLPTLEVYYYNDQTTAGHWSNERLYKQATHVVGRFEDYVEIITDVKTYNSINQKGTAIVVEGTVTRAEAYGIRTARWNAYDDSKTMPWADGRIVVVKASKIEF